MANLNTFVFGGAAGMESESDGATSKTKFQSQASHYRHPRLPNSPVSVTGIKS